MAIKKFNVREGFSFRIKDETGAEHVLSEGDTIDLPEEIGATTHQLELADPKARAKAAAAEAEAEAEAEKKAEEEAAAAEAVRIAEEEAARQAEVDRIEAEGRN